MATLEDKLLGEKLEYFCSSSEDEGWGEGEGDDAEGDESGKKGASGKQGANCYIDRDVCPTTQASGSSNTGAKGVVADWQRFKQLQAERREESERQRISMAKKFSMTTTTATEDEERKKQDELDAEFAELLSDDFLQQYQKQRMAEMMQQCGHAQQFGNVVSLTSHADFLHCIEQENKHITIIIHIFDKSFAACTTLNGCLDTLAKEYPTVKFAKICSSVAGMSRDFRKKGLPALVVYKSQALIGNFVRVTDDLSDDFFPSDVESFLIENAILVDKNLYNVQKL